MLCACRRHGDAEDGPGWSIARQNGSGENVLMANGVVCHHCGATTPLPSDLRASAFSCRYCHATLETARYAGSAAVSADVLAAHMQEIIENPPPEGFDSVPAPRFEQSFGTKLEICGLCGQQVRVPLDLQVSAFNCTSCGRTQSVRDYISDEDRLMLDLRRQEAGNRQLQAAREQGVVCGRCGGSNQIPDDGSVQIACRFCGAVVLLSEHVDADALARTRLWHNVMETVDEQVEKYEKRQRARDLKMTVCILAGISAVFVLAALFFGVVFWSAGFFE